MASSAEFWHHIVLFFRRSSCLDTALDHWISAKVASGMRSAGKRERLLMAPGGNVTVILFPDFRRW